MFVGFHEGFAFSRGFNGSSTSCTLQLFYSVELFIQRLHELFLENEWLVFSWHSNSETILLRKF